MTSELCKETFKLMKKYKATFMTPHTMLLPRSIKGYCLQQTSLTVKNRRDDKCHETKRLEIECVR